jgi:hypothetical protein
MKTNPSLKIFKLSTLASLGIAITAALVAQPVFAVHQFVMIENSSTSLTATYDGSPLTVTFVESDHWTITGFPLLVVFNPGLLLWIEPENSDLFNSFGNGVVFSDGPGDIGVPNGTTIDKVGVDGSDSAPISATFFDNGDVAGVPDAGSTLPLLGFASLGLAALRRKLSC